jgi:hypothetical protein
MAKGFCLYVVNFWGTALMNDGLTKIHAKIALTVLPPPGLTIAISSGGVGWRSGILLIGYFMQG